MSTEENKALVRRYTEEVVNTGNVDDIAAFTGPDYVQPESLTALRLHPRISRHLLHLS
jgi:hypothetical protein